MQIVEIHEQYEAAADAKLAKLAKRAAKYGQAIAVRKEPFDVIVKRQPVKGKAYEVVQPMIRYHVEGEAPRCGEYRFLAELEQVGDGVLVTGRADVELNGYGRDWHGQCEHCGKLRARKLGYVVEDAAGDRKIVGKACLRDHLGTDAPAAMIAQFQWLRDIAGMIDQDEDGGWGRVKGESSMKLLIIALAAALSWLAIGGVIALALKAAGA